MLKAQTGNFKNWILLTGATGLLGAALLSEFLKRGHRVLSVVRAPFPEEARQRLEQALTPWGLEACRFFETGQLVALRGDILRPSLGFEDVAIRHLASMVRSVVHAAGSTAFNTQVAPDLFRVNIEGTRNVFELAAACHCTDWHMISTAYVCGRTDHALEELAQEPPAFRNEYEHSKWIAEGTAQMYAKLHGASLTTYRPSVIVGHSETGIIKRFTGIYRVFRAVSMLARMAAQDESYDRYRVPLMIPGSADSRPNLVFVDNVASEFADLFERPDARGKVFHLTHPAPPKNADIQKALEHYYDIRGGLFERDVSSELRKPTTIYDELFHEAVLDTQAYLLESPVFDRMQTDRFVSQPPAPWTHARLLRLIEFAEKSRWRSSPNNDAITTLPLNAIAEYFTEFLPQAHADFSLSQFPGFDLIVRYVVGTSAAADWTCRYHQGRLIYAERTNGVPANVTYRIPEKVFWRIVRGSATPADSFLSGQVEVEGNIEIALKFAAIQREFVRQFPYPLPKCKDARN